MYDTTIITDADYGIDGSIVVTGTSILNRANSVTAGGLYGAVTASTTAATVGAATPTITDMLKALKATIYGDEAPEPPAPQAAAKPRKPPPALPVEAWATREFDADAAHAATLALCRGTK